MKKTIILVIAVLLAVCSFGQGNEEQIRQQAVDLFERGKFVEAHPLFAQLVSLHPRNEDYNFRFGASTIFVGSDYDTAIKHLKFAAHKAGVDPRAFYYLGLAHQLNYEFGPAIDSYNNFRNLADSKLQSGFDVQRRLDQCRSGSNLLSQVKDVVVLEKTEAGTDEFFRFFNLKGLGGRILTMPEELKTKEDQKRGGTSLIYYPGSTSIIYFASYGKDGSNGKDLYRTYLLPDGTFSKPELLKGKLNTPYDEDFPFMHPDGKTLYFCSKGHNSMGGYDIFRSIYDESTDSFSTPVNMDFAINTPDDDFFFVADSVNQVACFASGRSSAQGRVHVYKVRVQGIPVQVVFLQGEFISEITPDSKKAKIVVKDELTGRPIESTFSATASGEYVISLPKGGKYLMEVETDASPIIHEAVLEIPTYEVPVVLRQKLRLVRENGAERLIVDNFFDTPLQDRIAEYTAMMMRKKAGLDVNATPELLAALDKGNDLTVEKSIENAPMMAGFSEEKTVKGISDEMQAEAGKQAEQAEDLREKAGFAYAFAEKEFKEAQELFKEAESLYTDDPDLSDPNAIDNLRRSQIKLAEAEKKFSNAENAVEVGDASMEYADKLEAEATQLQLRSDALRQTDNDQTFDQAIELLQEEKQRRDQERARQDDPGSTAMELAEARQADSRSVLEKAQRLRDEENDIRTQIRSQQRIVDTGKKKEQEEASKRIAQLESELADIQNRINTENGKAKALENESADQRLRADLYRQLVIGEAEGMSIKPVVLSNSSRSQMEAGLLAFEQKSASIKVSDEERLSLIGEETIVTRNDLVKVDTKPASTEQVAVELKPVKSTREVFQLELKEMQASEVSWEQAYRMQVLKSSAISDLSAREAYLKSPQAKAEMQEQEINAELTELQNTREEIAATATPSYTTPTAKLSSKEIDEELRKIDPEYAGYQPSGESWKDELVRITYAQNAEEKIDRRIDLNNQRLLKEEDPALWKAIVDENEKLARMKASLPEVSGLAEVDRAHRESFAAAGAGNADLSTRIAAQKEMTEEYLELLNNYQQKMEDASGAATPEKQSTYVKAIDQLNALRESAQLRLSGLSGDQELAGTSQPVRSETSETTVSTEVADVPSSTTGQETTVQQAEEVATNAQSDTRQDGTAQNTPAPPTSREAVAHQPLSANQAIPETKEGIILRMMPDYPFEGTESASLIKSPAERIAVEKELISLINSSIQERERYAFTVEEAPEKERVEVEIQKLRAFRRETELRTMSWENAIRLGKEDQVSAEMGLAGSLTSDDKELFEYAFSSPETVDPKGAYESEVYEDLLESAPSDSRIRSNEAAIRSTQAEIEQKESELRQESKESKQKKLDKQIESLYAKVAEQEIRNAAELRGLAVTKYESNEALILDKREEKAELIQEYDNLDTKISQYESRAIEAFKDAEVIRKNAERISDPIEKNYRLREAFVMETEALEYQQKIITIIDNAEVLGSKEQVYYAALESEKRAEANMEAIAAAEAAKAAAEAATREEQLAQETETNSSVLQENNASEPIDSEPATEETVSSIESVAASNLPVPVIEQRSISAEVTQRKTAMNESGVWNGTTLTPNERAQRTKSEAYLRYMNLLKESDDRESRINQGLEERSRIVAETADLEAQIAKLDVAIANEQDEAVKAGLIEERKRLRSQAQVNYNRIELIDKQLDSDEQMLVNALDEMNRQAAIFTAPSESPTAEASAPVAPAAEATVRSSLFAYPDVLTADLFAVLSDAPYSSGSPIPIDPALPSGIIFKVQVGAFRNAIPQDLFGGFAPISGEKLNNGIIRYTVGLFRQYTGADLAKQEIRGMGYPDAFVVAFKDGVRIPLYEALAELGDDQIAAEFNNTRSNTIQGTNNGGTSGNTQAGGSGVNVSVPVTSAAESRNLSESSVGEEFDPSREDVNYYNVPNAAPANQVESLKGLFYTVQVGVYSKPVSAADLLNISPLNSERTTGGRVRYTTGIFNNLRDASRRKDEIRQMGIEDAFVTAYYNGQRVTMSKADELFQSIGPDVLNVTNALSDEDAVNEWYFEVFIGSYSGQVPADVAKAMLFLEESRGIVQRNENGAVSYYTGKVNSIQSARLIQQEFASYGVTGTEIVGYENGKQAPLRDYTGQ